MKTSLEEELKNFYNSNEEYYIYARRLNEPFTDERKEAFGLIPNGSFVLDVGCGTAENGKFISRSARYVGLDFSKIALDMASDYKSKSFYLVVGDVSRLCFKPNSFDVVLSTYSLEHFSKPKEVLDQMYMTCKKDGKIIIISPAWDLPFAFPPSMNMGRMTFKLLFYSLLRVFEDLAELLFDIKHDFKIIKNPSFIKDGYIQDNDTVYMLKAREIIRYLTEKKSCKIIYLSTSQDASGKGMVNRLKNLLVRFPIYKFGCSPVSIALQK